MMIFWTSWMVKKLKFLLLSSIYSSKFLSANSMSIPTRAPVYFSFSFFVLRSKKGSVPFSGSGNWTKYFSILHKKYYTLIRLECLSSLMVSIYLIRLAKCYKFYAFIILPAWGWPVYLFTYLLTSPNSPSPIFAPRWYFLSKLVRLCSILINIFTLSHCEC